MQRVRVSIAGMMAVVLLVALGFAALRNASAAWAGVMALVVVGILGTAMLGAILRRGARRAVWLGFLIFGGAYFLIAHPTILGSVVVNRGGMKWTSDVEPPALVTTLLLESMQPTAQGAQTADSVFAHIFASDADRAILKELDRVIPMRFPQETPLEDILKDVTSATTSERFPNGLPIYVDPQGLQGAEKTLQSPAVLNLDGLPLRTSLRLILEQLDLCYVIKDGYLLITYVGGLSEDLQNDFQRVGHSLFVLIFGAMGAAIAAVFWATRDKDTA